MLDKKDLLKKNTTKWLSIFPELSAYSPNKLYRVVGCCVLGLELVKRPHSDIYRPYFVIYGLWGKDVKSCMSRPLLIKDIYNSKNLQFDIPYSNNEHLVNEAKDCILKQVPIIQGVVTLGAIFELIDYSFTDILVKSNSMQQAKLFELKYFIALYLGNDIEIENILNQIEQIKSSWNMQIFEAWFGKFSTWYEGLESIKERREDFLAQIKANRKDKHIIKLFFNDFKLK